MTQGPPQSFLNSGKILASTAGIPGGVMLFGCGRRGNSGIPIPAGIIRPFADSDGLNCVKTCWLDAGPECGCCWAVPPASSEIIFDPADPRWKLAGGSARISAESPSVECGISTGGRPEECWISIRPMGMSSFSFRLMGRGWTGRTSGSWALDACEWEPEVWYPSDWMGGALGTP